MDFNDKCNRFAIEYASINNIKNIDGFDNLPEYHQGKVALIIDKKIGIPCIKYKLKAV